MSRVRVFFIDEATECLAALEDELSGRKPDPTELHRAIRRLRGSAQVARFGALAREARSLEESLKPVADRGSPLGDGLARRVRDVIPSLARAVDAVREGRMEPDEREPLMDEQEHTEMATDEVVAIDELEYQGPAALERARALRDPLEETIMAGDPPGAILDELFDLIRLGTK
jgi:HPt (histidine-containing phosphotransfer) domain-containing protein